MYIPYIAKYMLEANDTKYFNVKGIQINDPVIGIDWVQSTGKSCLLSLIAHEMVPLT